MTPEAKDALKRIYDRSVSGRPSVQVRRLEGKRVFSLASKAGVCLDLFLRGGGPWRA